MLHWRRENGEYGLWGVCSIVGNRPWPWHDFEKKRCCLRWYIFGDTTEYQRALVMHSYLEGFFIRNSQGRLRMNLAALWYFANKYYENTKVNILKFVKKNPKKPTYAQSTCLAKVRIINQIRSWKERTWLVMSSYWGKLEFSFSI